jgi:hypothetical protein
MPEARANMSKKKYQWSDLRRIGRSRLLRSSYVWLFVVPIAAKALSAASDLASFSLLGQEFTLALELPFSWKVFYFSAVAFSIASFIYSVWCPSIVRNFEHYMAFLQQGRDINYFARYEGRYKKVDELLSKFDELESVSPFSKLSEHMSGPSLERMETRERVARQVTQELFWTARASEDGQSRWAFGFCAFFYIAGSGLILWVLGENLFYVIQQSL